MVDVSFVVPIYNVELYLEKCIDSLLRQTHQSFEIILVDDGSPDRCGIICDNYAAKDSRVRVIHKPNGGLSSARNIGIDMATGKWLCFIDSDDYLEDNHIELLLNNSSERTYDIIIGHYYLHDQTINKSYIPIREADEGTYNKELIENVLLRNLIKSGACMSVWKNLYKSELIKNHSLSFVSERLVYAEDYIFNIEAYSVSDYINVVATTTYHHILQKKSLSQSYRKGYYLMAIRRYYESFDRIHKYHGTKFDDCVNRTTIISTSLYKESLCKYSIAINNIRQIIHSDFAQSIFKESSQITGKYRLLYHLAKYKLPCLVVSVAKLFSFSEKPYRLYKYLCSIR